MASFKSSWVRFLDYPISKDLQLLCRAHNDTDSPSIHLFSLPFSSLHLSSVLSSLHLSIHLTSLLSCSLLFSPVLYSPLFSSLLCSNVITTQQYTHMSHLHLSPHPIIRCLHGCCVYVYVERRGCQVCTLRSLGTQNAIPGED